MYKGLDIKDTFLHVPMRPEIKKFWRGTLYEWQVLPFCLKCSQRILALMVKLILAFFSVKNISLMAFMDDFTNLAKCDCKVIFEIHVKVLDFMF